MVRNLIRKLLPILSILSIAAPAYAGHLTPAVVTPAGQTVAVPQVAIDNSPKLEVVTIIHYKKGFGHKPQHNPGGGTGQPSGATCYGYISKGAKLVATEDLVYNHADSGLSQAAVEAAIANSATEWDGNTSASLFGALTYSASANFDSSPDGVNELSFGDYPTNGVIAVARVWGIFSGPPSGRYIDQFDIQFDTDFAWGTDGSLALMDLQNIATHEIGHGVGLADVYDAPCVDVTMYGYSDNGETKKRDLASQDVTGLQGLYGI